MGSNIVPDEHRNFAKRQRSAPTRAEKDLWRELRAGRFNRMKFRRQAPIGGYVADFVCFEARLVVELDGEPHMNEVQKIRDRSRDRWFASQGFRVLRFTNDDMLGDPRRVMTVIAKALEAPSLGSR